MLADAELTALFEEFFEREVSFELVDEVERTGELPHELWAKAMAVEIPWVGIDESSGGVGGTIADVAALVQAAAYRAAPLPLLEHHLAAAAATRAGLARPDGLLTFTGLGPVNAPRVVEGRLTGRFPDVAWAADCAALVVLTRDEADRDVVAVVEAGQVKVEQSRDLAGMPCGTVVADEAPADVAETADLTEFGLYADVLRSAALAAVQKRLYDLTSSYVAERHQFGKPVGSFQAVQAHTVLLAQCASMSLVAVDRAINALSTSGGAFEVPAAAVVVGENAVRAAMAAHQAHGAIGMTREYPLQLFTRRLHVLRQLWCPQHEHVGVVGDLALATMSLSQLVARHPEASFVRS